MWWQSSTGAFWLRFNDGNSVQWVQVNSNLILPPQDGGEYVMRNGLWRLKSQRLILDGAAMATGVQVAVPQSAKAMRYNGQMISSSATAFNAELRLSIDGTNFIGGASDYAVSGAYFQSAALTWANYNTTALSFLMLGVNQASANNPAMFEGHFNLQRAATANLLAGLCRSGSYQAATHYQGLFNIWCDGAAWSAATQIKALSFGSFTYAGTINEGFVDLEWVY